jgi:hypothetical protein
MSKYITIAAKYLIKIAILTLILLLLYEVFRRSEWLSWAIFLVLPIVFYPFWKKREKHSLFGWVKLYSVTFSVAFSVFMRFTALQEFDWTYLLIYLLLVLNIVEAILLDISKRSYKHYLNAFAGLALILTLPATSTIRVDTLSIYNDLSWTIPLSWVIGYTIWNLVFVYIQTPQHVAMHTAVLGSALIIGFLSSDLWLQARAYTLGIFLILFFTRKPLFDPLRVTKTLYPRMITLSVLVSFSYCTILLLNQVMVG